jgi:protein-S-isoprenylcysteine O-methyltransferase Ste14
VTHFFVSAAICFVCYAARSVFSALAYRKSPFVRGKVAGTAVFVVMLLLWGSWFHMCFSDPVRVVFPDWLRYAGLALFVAGVCLFLLSNLKLHVAKGREGFARTGIYSRIRSPMYLGFVVWVVGYPVYRGCLVTLISSVVWIAHVFYWKVLEERELEQRYEDYREYRRKTWF